MAMNKRAREAEQAKQLTELLKDYGITVKRVELTPKERKKLDELFPD